MRQSLKHNSSNYNLHYNNYYNYYPQQQLYSVVFQLQTRELIFYVFLTVVHRSFTIFTISLCMYIFSIYLVNLPFTAHDRPTARQKEEAEEKKPNTLQQIINNQTQRRDDVPKSNSKTAKSEEPMAHFIFQLRMRNV